MNFDSVEAGLTSLGVPGLLVGVIVWLVKTWVPTSSMEKAFTAQEARVTEAVARENRALDVAEKLYLTVEKQAEQLDKLMAGQEATLHIIQAWNTERAKT